MSSTKCTKTYPDKALCLKIVLFLFYASLSLNGYSQNRIYHSSDDIKLQSAGQCRIEKIQIPWGRLGKSIRVTYADGAKTDFGKRAIWGFEKDGKKYRLYDAEIFEIVDSSVIILYKSFSPHPVYYFSKDFQGNVVLFERPKLIKEVDAQALVRLWKENSLVKQIW